MITRGSKFLIWNICKVFERCCSYWMGKTTAYYVLIIDCVWLLLLFCSTYNICRILFAEYFSVKLMSIRLRMWYYIGFRGCVYIYNMKLLLQVIYIYYEIVIASYRHWNYFVPLMQEHGSMHFKLFHLLAKNLVQQWNFTTTNWRSGCWMRKTSVFISTSIDWLTSWVSPFLFLAWWVLRKRWFCTILEKWMDEWFDIMAQSTEDSRYWCLNGRWMC